MLLLLLLLLLHMTPEVLPEAREAHHKLYRDVLRPKQLSKFFRKFWKFCEIADLPRLVLFCINEFLNSFFTNGENKSLSRSQDQKFVKIWIKNHQIFLPKVEKICNFMKFRKKINNSILAFCQHFLHEIASTRWVFTRFTRFHSKPQFSLMISIINSPNLCGKPPTLLRDSGSKNLIFCSKSAFL